MSATYKYIYDCEELLKYLNNESNEKIQEDTAIAAKTITASVTAINNWRQLKKNSLCQKRIDALNNRAGLSIASFTEIDKLCNTVSLDNTSSNSKRIFFIFFSANEEFEFRRPEDIKTPLEKYMVGVLNVTSCCVKYLPGRSVSLDMLYNFGKTLNARYTKPGIARGLKALVEAGLVEAFKVIEVIEKSETKYKVEPVSKEEISAYADEILYKINIAGCKEYYKKSLAVKNIIKSTLACPQKEA